MTTTPTPNSDDRAAFEAKFKNLDLSTEQDCWGVPQYRNSHVDAIWCGWKAARSPAPGWQDISTAPKDGRTMLLGFYNSHKKWRTMRGQWMSEQYIAQCWEDPDDVEPGWFETVVESDDIPNCWRTDPTHWHPLPLPPEPAGDDK